MRFTRSTIASLALGAALPLTALAVTQPTPKRTVAPRLDAELAQANGEVRVLAHIDEYGLVTDASIHASTNEALNDSVLDAIRDWTFAPAMDGGRAIPSKAIQPFRINDDGALALAETSAGDRHPYVFRKEAPELDERLSNITGKVLLEASLDERGRVTEVAVKSATHHELGAPAANALKDWNFKPAMKDGRPVASKVIVPFKFTGNGNVAKTSETAQRDRAPVPARRPTRELADAIGEQRGEAKLLLLVDENGYVVDTETVEASSPQLAAIARKAVLQWRFKPALREGAPVAAHVLQPFSFNGGLIAPEEPVDSKPVAQATKSPDVPESLASVQGYVQVRLELDERGNVLSASSVRSSHAELEQPTLQAAQEWKFKPAKRGGQEISSTVLIPFVFNR